MNTPSKYSARLIKKNESVFCLSLLVYSRRVYCTVLLFIISYYCSSISYYAILVIDTMNTAVQVLSNCN
jgi:hypothetical protein